MNITDRINYLLAKYDTYHIDLQTNWFLSSKQTQTFIDDYYYI